MDKLKDSVRAKTETHQRQQLVLHYGSLSQTLQGWFGYFKHCHWNVFTDVDGWIRMRLCAAYCVNVGAEGVRGRGSGPDALAQCLLLPSMGCLF